MNPEKNTITNRPGVVVVMGHIDHGKSTLLDYIRKTNVVENEIGGITQRLSAYEVLHRDLPRLGEAGEKGLGKKITFLDTPGHEAFSKMRERGAQVADIAILVVSAEDGVKPQTIEAWKTIKEAHLPVIVAINKIDKPGANVEKTKMELAENEIYLENYGGKIPFVEISAKAGTGVDNLLSLILILAEMENFTGDIGKNATGFVIEAHLDSRRGIQATLLIKEGTLKKGMTIVAEDSICSTRLIENFKGITIEEASLSAPVRIFGFDKMPKVGANFKSFKNKKDALEYARDWQNKNLKKEMSLSADAADLPEQAEGKIIPIVVKADVSGTLEAIEKEISKIKNEGVEFKIVTKGVGPISESDIKTISSGGETLIIGFNVKADKSALEVAQKRGITISFFDIIYKMTEWLKTEMEARRPRVETKVVIGKAKILRAFSRTKERQIVGGRVTEGQMSWNGIVRIMRREFEIGRGKIVNLEKNKVKTSMVEESNEFGMMVESKIEIAEGDVVELFSVTQK
ncbi:translation initiation factor IF-2 [Candidatus Nomurabacteria bacterium RIFCSPHIGHO2_01_FULL_38_19]|uniref:Translation initiation factor IF-2 n=1 Tax=Candidatus Nomurabacteria bacterium RIFCSPHIGHO2_01_FULL_38_19 TaxID=1801732 RepID=A0A1F6URV3_9BACT|nr:MAG: translation initiation factor IF-2 [Candidatus Nomurabacteria bacterium RIFCSPHIGHO2_01_FULL_38_19]